MAETMIKGRRRGEVVPFSQLPTTGEITSFPTIKTPIQTYENRNYKKGMMSPYSRFIPLSYVMLDNGYCGMPTYFKGSENGYFSIFFKGEFSMDSWKQVYENRFLTHPAKDLVWSACRDKNKSPQENIMDYLYSHICTDYPQEINAYIWDNFHTKEHVTACFSGEQFNNYSINRFVFKSYAGYVSDYSLWINGERDVKHPHIIAVVRAEDWVYQRLYMLLHRKPDMSRVIILVDNRVDGQFPFPAFKGYYKEQLEPELKKLSCPVFKVPHDYILENCFIEEFQLKEKNIFRRKKAVEELIDNFYKKYGVATFCTQETVSYAVSGTISATVSGNYVASIDPAF